MKYLAFVVVILVSCSRKKETFPICVRNVCGDKWAIATGRSHDHQFDFWGSNKDQVYTFESINSGNVFLPIDDTVANAAIGQEFQFDDSLSAVLAYDKWVKVCLFNDEVLRKYEMRLKNEKRIKDSIFSCQHTYK